MDLKEKREAVKTAFRAMEVAHEAIEKADESADADALKASFDEARSAHAAAKARLADAELLEEARSGLPVEPVADTPVVEDPAAADVKVTRSELTYEKYGRNSMLTDVRNAKSGDRAAQERLDRHHHEMEVEGRTNPNQTAGQGGEFIPPLWLTEYVKLPRSGRPVADSLNKHPLPSGTNSISLPKVATGATVAVQTDAGSVSSTDITTTSITAAVQTIAGQQDVSQQLLDMSVPGIDAVIFDDLVRAHDTKTESLVLNGTVTNAKGISQVSSIGSVTWTQTTPTVATMYSKVVGATATVQTGIYRSPDVIAMTPQRWAFVLAASDTAGRPLVVPVGSPGFNAVGLQNRVAAESIVGSLAGIPVVISNSIVQTNGAGTNQDEIYVFSSQDIHLYESAPVLRTFEEVLSGTLQVRFQLYNYYAIAAGRLPAAIAKVSGSGLVAPSF